jgi:hypothetical protein
MVQGFRKLGSGESVVADGDDAAVGRNDRGDQEGWRMDDAGVVLSNRDLAAAVSQENTGFERSESGAEGVSDESSTS